MNTGVATSTPSEVYANAFKQMNDSRPPKTEVSAAALPQCLKAGSSPRIIGIEIGPTSAVNQAIIKPKTPPNDLDRMATAIVIRINTNVVTRAIIKTFFVLNEEIRLKKKGRISLVITAEMVFASADVIDKVLANMDANNKPTKPGGKNFMAINE